MGDASKGTSNAAKIGCLAIFLWFVWLTFSMIGGGIGLLLNLGLIGGAVALVATPKGKSIAASLASKMGEKTSPIVVAVILFGFAIPGAAMSVMSLAAGSVDTSTARTNPKPGPAPRTKTRSPAQPVAQNAPPAAKTNRAPTPSCASIDKKLRTLEKRVEIEIEAHPGEQGLIVVAKTNLPEGTEMMTTVSGGGYSGQSKANVKGGCMVAGPFSDRGKPLGPGAYEAEVLMPIVAVQPPEAKSVLKAKGFKLRGPLVERDSLGTTVSKTQEFTVGSEEDVKAATRARKEARKQEKADVRRIRKELADLIKEGRSMKHLREASGGPALRECGNRMRANQPEARRLRKEIQDLPSYSSLAFADLENAAVNAEMCVSCLQSAASNCRDAERALKRFR